MKCTPIIVASMLATFIAGCSYPNQFRNVRTDSPHATLAGDGVKLTHINDQPTSFWRSAERFRILPGVTTVRVISGYRGDVHYPMLRFSAQAGHKYLVQQQQFGSPDYIVLGDSGQQVIAQAQGAKEE